MKMNMEHWWNNAERESNLGLLRERTASNNLSHNTILLKMKKPEM